MSDLVVKSGLGALLGVPDSAINTLFRARAAGSNGSHDAFPITAKIIGGRYYYDRAEVAKHAATIQASVKRNADRYYKNQKDRKKKA